MKRKRGKRAGHSNNLCHSLMRHKAQLICINLSCHPVLKCSSVVMRMIETQIDDWYTT